MKNYRLNIQNVFFLMIVFSSNIYGQSQIVSLWEGEVPNIKETSIQEARTQTDVLRISNVIEPTLEIFMPSNRNNLKKAIVICPGGGYKYLSYDWEGTDFAKWFNAKGIVAFVLKYRLPEDSICSVPHDAPLQDAQRAIRWVRQHSDKFQIDQSKIGIMGFSAGGHLASTLGTRFNALNNFNEQPIDSISARPDFMVLAYPVITMSEEFAHKGSRNNLLGQNPSEELKHLYSNELQITEDTPPTFIVHSQDDKSVPVENSLKFFQALKDNSVQSEMHIYPYGGHGFGLALGTGYLQTWTDRLHDWLLKI